MFAIGNAKALLCIRILTRSSPAVSAEASGCFLDNRIDPSLANSNAGSFFNMLTSVSRLVHGLTQRSRCSVLLPLIPPCRLEHETVLVEHPMSAHSKMFANDAAFPCVQAWLTCEALVRPCCQLSVEDPEWPWYDIQKRVFYTLASDLLVPPPVCQSKRPRMASCQDF